MAKNSGLTIGGLALATGCGVETIRYYERIGLIPKAARRGRYRNYGSDDVVRLTVIRRSRLLGFSLAEIGELFRLGEQESGTCADVRSLAARQLQRVRERIGELQALEKVLKEEIDGCDAADGARCPMLDKLAQGRRDDEPAYPRRHA